MIRFTKAIIWVLVTALYLPFCTAFIDVTAVAAADASTTLALQDKACLAAVQLLYGKTPDQDPGDVVVTTIISAQSIKTSSFIGSEARMAAITSPEYFDAVAAFLGPVGIISTVVPDTEIHIVAVCSNYPREFEREVFSPLSYVTPNVLAFERAAQETQKITFAQPLDQYYLLGERCAGGFDKTLLESGKSPCKNFDQADDAISNGQWDAPKVDIRVLDTLIYLTSPIELGGAGRDHIRVKKLVQTIGGDPLADTSGDKAVAEDTSNAAAIAAGNAVPTPSATTSAVTTTNDANSSAYRINLQDLPYKPTQVSTAVMIDEIDKMRVTTKTSKSSIIGGTKNSYSYEAPTPIKVAWQSDDGIASSPLPTFNQASQIENSHLMLNASIVNVMNQFGLGDLEIDVTKAKITDFSDVARLVGQSLFEQLLGTPNGSLKGYDLASVLTNIGLSYVEQKLSLVPGSLADTNVLDNKKTSADFNDLAKSIGQATVEYVMGYPHGSLRTDTGTSLEVLESLGRSHLESNLFRVKTGSLKPSDGYPIDTIGDLLARLGEGAIESTFQLPAQSMRVQDYDKLRDTSLKAKLLFPKLSPAWTRDQIDTSNWISNQLKLTFVPVKADSSINSYGFSKTDFDNPSLTVAPNDLQKFKQLVGSRVIENTLGVFSRQGLAAPNINGKITNARTTSNTVKVITPLSTSGNLTNYSIEYKGYDPDLFPTTVQTIGAGDKVNLASFCDQGGSPIFQGNGGGFNNGNGLGNAYVVNQGFAYQYLGYGAPGDINAYQKALQDAQTSGAIDAGSAAAARGVDAAACTSVRTQDTLVDTYDLVSRIKTSLFSATPAYVKILLNQDKAPQLTDLPEGRWRQQFYNTLTLMYYNLSENHAMVSLNVLTHDTSEYNTTRNIDGNGTETSSDTSSIADKTIFEAIDEIKKTLPSAGGLDVRLAQITNRLDAIQSAYSSVNLAELPETALNAELVKRLNLLTEMPARRSDAYGAQYNNPSYLGLLYLIGNLSEQIDCISRPEGGVFSLSSDNTDNICVAAPDSQPSSTQIHYLNEIKGKINTLITGTITPVYESLMSAINQSTQNDPTGDGQSAMSSLAGLSSIGTIEDGNRRISLDANGRIAGTSTDYSRDMLRALVSPTVNGDGSISTSASVGDFFKVGNDGRSLLGEVGRIRAAQTFSTDKLSQRSFTSKLKSDFGRGLKVGENASAAAARLASSVGLADKNSQAIGISVANTQDKGLASGDFQRLFQLDLGDEVFQRVGKEELLRVVWQQAGLKDRTASSYQGVIKQLTQFIQTIDFYNSRIDRLSTLSKQITSDLDQLGSFASSLKTTFDSFSTSVTSLRGTNAKEITEAVRQQEPTLSAAKRELQKSGKSIGNLQVNINEFAHILQEIAAGQSLPKDALFNFTGGTNLTGTVSLNKGDPCFNPASVLTSLKGTSGDISQRIGELATNAASCVLESELGLPSNTIAIWRQLNEKSFPSRDTAYGDLIVTENEDGEQLESIQSSSIPDASQKYFEEQADGKSKALVPVWDANSFSINSLQIAAGVADSLYKKGSSSSISPGQAVADLRASSVSQINTYSANGKKVLELTALSKIAGLIPGFNKFVKSNGLTQRDLVKILNGDVRPLIGKVGGGQIDKALGFKPGTMNGIIYPVCHDNSGKEIGCINDPNQPNTNPENVITQQLIIAGMDKLGLAAPNFPKNFSFKNAGTFTEAWGNALISEKLGLAPNTFRGKIGTSNDASSIDCATSLLRCKNSNALLGRAFGFGDSPYLQQLDKIIAKVKALYKSEGITSGYDSVIDYLNKIEDQYRFDSTFGLLSQGDFDASTGYWTKITDKATAATRLSTLNASELKLFNTTLSTIWKDVSGILSNNPAVAVVRRAIVEETVENQSAAAYDAIQELIRSNRYLSVLGENNYAFIDLIGGSQQTIDNRVLTYQTLVNGFQFRLKTLDQTYGNLDPKGKSFEAFVLNQIDGATLNQEVGGTKNFFSNYMANILDKWFDSSAPDILKTANGFFKIATQNPNICGTSVGIGKFLADMVTAPGSSANCGFKGLSALNMNDLLLGSDKTNTALRLFLVDHFIGHATLGDLEKDFGLRRGALTKIITRPKEAAQILTQEGIIMLHDQIFGGVKNQPCGANPLDTGCAANSVIGALNSAYFAGFCPTYSVLKRNTAGLLDADKCSFNYDIKRSATAFSDSMYKYIDNAIKSISRKELGVELSKSDIQLLLAGDSRGYNLVGTQLLVNQLQTQIFRGNKNDPNIKFYAISYQEVRDSVGLFNSATGPLSDKEIERIAMMREVCGSSTSVECSSKTTSFTDVQGAYFQAYRTTWGEGIRINLNNGGDPSKLAEQFPEADVNHDGILTNEDIDSYSSMRTSNSFHDPAMDQAYFALASNKEKIRLEKERSSQILAEKRLTYKMLDLAAYNADKNIPPGFAERVLSGEQSKIVDALGNYIFTDLMRSSGSIGSAIRSVCGSDKSTQNIQNCYAFINKLGAALKETDSAKQKLDYKDLLLTQGGFMGNLDKAVQGFFSKSIGINLPSGTFTGLIAWTASGAKWADLNKNTITVGGKSFVPVGRIIQNQLTNQAITWFAKSTKMSLAQAHTLYNLTSGVIDLIKLQSVARNLQSLDGLYNSLIKLEDFANPEYAIFLTGAAADNAKNIKINQKQILDAKISIANVLVDFVIDHFGLGKFFSSLDKEFGVPPGTMAVVGRAVLLTGALMLVGFSAAAAIAAAFGPAFFIALGLAVLFGESVTYKTLASGNGDYPFYNRGLGEAKRTKPQFGEQAINPDRDIEAFDVTNKTTYKIKVKEIAREKVRGLILDLLSMPNSGYANSRGYAIDPTDMKNGKLALWVSQLFTYFNPAEGDAANPLKSSDSLVQNMLNSNSPFLSGNDPFGYPYIPGWGYGPTSLQCKVVTPSLAGNICTRTDGWYSGMFAVKNKGVLGGVHIAF